MMEEGPAQSWDEQIIEWAKKWNPVFDLIVKIGEIIGIIIAAIIWILSKIGPVLIILVFIALGYIRWRNILGKIRHILD